MSDVFLPLCMITGLLASLVVTGLWVIARLTTISEALQVLARRDAQEP